MAAGIFNIAKGKIAYYAELPASGDRLVGVLLQDGGDDNATLADFDTLDDILGGSNECNFTNYARKTLASVTVNVSDTNNRVDIDCADLTYTSAGGGGNDDDIAKLIICYDPTGSSPNSDLIPISYHDVGYSTTGSTFTLVVTTSGFARAS